VVRRDCSLQNCGLAHNLHVHATGRSDGMRTVQLVGNLCGNRRRRDAWSAKADRVARGNRNFSARADTLCVCILLTVVVTVVLAVRAAAILAARSAHLAPAKLTAALAIHAGLRSVLSAIDSAIGQAADEV